MVTKDQRAPSVFYDVGMISVPVKAMEGIGLPHPLRGIRDFRKKLGIQETHVCHY
jgi:hypothetical protein